MMTVAFERLRCAIDGAARECANSVIAARYANAAAAERGR